jgi:hypothetical protein
MRKAAVQNEDGNWEFIDLKGKLVIPYTYSREPSRFMSGLACVKNKYGLKGYINKANEVVIPPHRGVNNARTYRNLKAVAPDFFL